MRLPLLSSLLAVSLGLLVLAVGSLADDWAPPNLAQNPGFEDVTPDGKPVGWGAYAATTDAAHSGQRSLCYENADPNRYVLSSQKVALQPGKAYEVSVWVKTQDVQGEDTGATVCLQWYDADGRYLGGCYPAGHKGTTDWGQVSAISGRVPEKAANCNVTCYLRKGMTGKAWWDDVEVRQWRQPPLETLLLKPSYRGEVQPGLKRIEAFVKLELRDWDVQLRHVVLSTEIRRRDGDALVRSDLRTPRSAETIIRLPTGGLAPGRYDLRISAQRKRDGSDLEAESWRLTVPEPEAFASRKSFIDEHNRLVIDGEPFFPLGMYWGSINEDDLRLYADSAFNCLMPYGSPDREQMDLAQRYRLKVIYSIKDIYHGSTYCPKDVQTTEDERAHVEAKAAAFREHPALLAWYLNDELPQTYMDRLEAHQEWMEGLDPDHPTWVVLWQVGEVQHYVRSFDAIGTDPYPIPGDKARRAGAWTKTTVAAVRDARPVWMVPQVFNWACYRKTEEEKRGLRPPTLAEMRSMTWQCLAEGAQGLIYYSWFDIKRDTEVPFEEQWGYVKQVAAEVKEMMPVLLSVDPAPTFETRERDWLHWTTRKFGKTAYLIVVNDEGRAHSATFDLGRAPKRLRLHGDVGALPPRTDGLLEVELEPFGVRIYELGF